MGMNLKQRIKRAAAWALAFTIAVPFVSFGAAAAAQESARETGWYAPKEHAGVDFSQMEYRRYELADMEKAIRGDAECMHLDYTKDVMDMMTEFRKEWGFQYPEEM